MVTIVADGRMIRKFSCRTCGCVFKAGMHDYRFSLINRTAPNEKDLDQKLTHCLMIDCPQCIDTVRRYIDASQPDEEE